MSARARHLRGGTAYVVVEGDDGRWAVPATRAVAVRRAAVRPLPDPGPGVAGLHDGDGDPVPVSTALAADGPVVVLVEGRGGVVPADGGTGGRAEHGARVALLARRVIGVAPLPDATAAPAGQRRRWAAGATTHDDQPVLVLDVDVLVGAITAGEQRGGPA